MIGFFKDPYPDELLYSACARFSEQMKYPNLATAIRELFGSNASAMVDLPNRLDNLIAVLPPGHRYTADHFIDNHTLFPFYSPFLPVERAILIRKHMRGSGENHLRERLGIKANGIQLPDHLRFCPVCVDEDRKKFGETYWHRLHQITGVEVCSIHEVFLELSEAPWHAQRRHNKFIICDRAVHNTASRPLNLTNPQHYCFLKIARDFAWLLNQPGFASDPKVLRDRYHSLLLKYRYAYYNGRIRTAKLIKDFLAVYPTEILASFHSQLENSYRSWLLRLLHPHKSTTIQSPLRHLLLITFLGYTAEEFFTSFEEYKPFAEGPWPCLNHASEHFEELRITECRITDYLSKKKSGRPMGTFSCSCGFVYIRVGPDNAEEDRFRIDNVQSYGSVWEQTLRNCWGNLDITVQEISEKLGVSHLTVTRHAIRLQLPMNVVGARVVSKKLID